MFKFNDTGFYSGLFKVQKYVKGYSVLQTLKHLMLMVETRKQQTVVLSTENDG